MRGGAPLRGGGTPPDFPTEVITRDWSPHRGLDDCQYQLNSYLCTLEYAAQRLSIINILQLDIDVYSYIARCACLYTFFLFDHMYELPTPVYHMHAQYGARARPFSPAPNIILSPCSTNVALPVLK